MPPIIRTLAAIALAGTWALGPPSAPARADDGGDNLAEAVRAFKAQKFREIDEAVLELQELIEEKARALAAMEAELRDAREELKELQALSSLRAAPPARPAASADPLPTVPPLEPTPLAASPVRSAPAAGTLDSVIPAAVVAIEDGWRGTLRIASADGGRLDVLHEGGDSSGTAQAGALRATLLELRVDSADDARVIARSLRADGRPVVSWPDLRILPESDAQAGRIESLEATIHRLAEAVDRIDRRTSAGPSANASDPVVIAPPSELPPAPTIPD